MAVKSGRQGETYQVYGGRRGIGAGDGVRTHLLKRDEKSDNMKKTKKSKTKVIHIRELNENIETNCMGGNIDE